MVLLSNWVVEDEADLKLMFMGLTNERVELANLVKRYVNEHRLAPVALTQRIVPLIRDREDAHVLAGAMVARADWLVTANTKHFEPLHAGITWGVCILTVEKALPRLLPRP